MTKKIIPHIIYLCLGLPVISFAQNDTALNNACTQIDQMSIYRPWLQTNNAAAMSISNLPATGRTYANTTLEQGSFKRAQQPEEVRQMQFASEGYRPLKKAVLYGNFAFTQQWDKALAWTDVLNTYNDNPYIIADSIGGNWTKQLYNLQLKAASAPFLNNKAVAGLGIDYKVATGARQKDPRPLNNANEWLLRPSILYQLNKNHTLGLSGAFGSNKEEISFDRKNTTVNHALYYLQGMGYYRQGIFSGTATRAYKGNTWGGDMQYAWSNTQWQWLTEASYLYHTESVTDGTSSPANAGKTAKENTSLRTTLTYKSNLVHRGTLRYDKQTLVGTEYHNYYNSESKAWQTLLEAPFYTSSRNTTALSYDLIKPAGDNAYKWLINVDITLQNNDNRYLRPQSKQNIENLVYAVSAIKNWQWKRGNSLELSLGALRNGCIQNHLQYPTSENATIIDKNIFYPDNAYLTTDFWQWKAGARYDFKLRNTKAMLYTKANAILQNSSEKHSVYNNITGDRRFFQLSVGISY